MININQKLDYLNIIEYGINNIGKETKISDLKETFKGKAIVMNDLEDNTQFLFITNLYLGQEHLRLFFEQNSFCEFLDFDLIPNNHLFKSNGGIKKLVNFKLQIFGKNKFLWRTSLTRPKMEIYLNLKKQYGLPNDFSHFDEKKKDEFVKVSESLRESLESFGTHLKDIWFWYIEKEGIYYHISFYYFKGTREVPSYLSFAISEMFKY
jgi:hypothetical protein